MKKRVRIKLVRLDVADEAVGLKYGQEFDAKLAQSSGGEIFFIVDAPNHPEYYLRNAQVEKVKQ